MRLLPPEAFAHVLEPLRGKRVGFVRPFGNVGDLLIEWATRQLFAHFEIPWREFDPGAPRDDVDELVFGGGGNMGTMYQNNWELRMRCLRLGLPMTILPQSFTTPEQRPYKRVYCRERASLRLAPGSELAPDLVLGLDYQTRTPARKAWGIFIRRDYERTRPKSWLRRDPAKICQTPRQYLELAARYQHVVTDRLHFAIAALIVGRKVTLLPNSYHKNESMYQTWLHPFDCQFAHHPPSRLLPNWRNLLRRRSGS